MTHLPAYSFMSSCFFFFTYVPAPSIVFKMKTPTHLPSYFLSPLMNIISLLHNVFMQNKYISLVVKEENARELKNNDIEDDSMEFLT